MATEPVLIDSDPASAPTSPPVLRGVVLGLSAAVLLAYVAVLVGPLAPGTRDLWAACVYLLPLAAAVASSAFVLALGVQPSERPFWALLLLSSLAFLVGNAWYAWQRTTGIAGDASRFSDVALIVGYAALVGSIGSWSSLRIWTGRERTVRLLDVVAASAALFVVTYGFAIAPSEESGAPALQAIAHLLFPLADTAVVVVLALALTGFKRTAWKRYEVVAAAGAFLVVVADLILMLSTAGAAHGAPASASMLSGVVWVAAFLALFLAGTDRMFNDPEPLKVSIPDRIKTPWLARWREIAGAVAVFAVVPLMMLAVRETSLTSLLVIMAAGVVMGAAVLARLSMGRSETLALRDLVTRDEVTGLRNGAYLQGVIEGGVHSADREHGSLTVAYLDMEGLDVINQAAGREAGDRALREIAAVLTEGVGRSGEVGRVDGGRFAAVFAGPRSFDAYVLCRTIVETAARDGSLDAVLSVTCGLATFPEQATTAQALCEHADMAARTAAARGGGAVLPFDAECMTVPEPGPGAGRSPDPVRTLQSLAGAIDAADPDTRSHSANVAILAACLGSRIGLDAEHVERLRVAGTLHDVGKVGIPEDILTKDDTLSEPEMGTMRSHPELGARMLAATDASEIAPWVRGHHERWDGNGYPDRVGGSSIPLAARIIAIADAYDAMTSPRPWRREFTADYALGQLSEGAGAQFDPQLVAAFSAMIESDGDPRRDLRPASRGNGDRSDRDRRVAS